MVINIRILIYYWNNGLEINEIHKKPHLMIPAVNDVARI